MRTKTEILKDMVSAAGLRYVGQRGIPKLSHLYVIQVTEKTTCPSCHKQVDLLCRDDVTGPSFYICWNCRRVFQVGKGEVQRDD